MTTGLFTRVSETTRDSLLGNKTIRTPVALPTDVADAKRSVTSGRPTSGPSHARPRTVLAAGDRRRLLTAVGGLAAIFFVLMLAGVAARHIHVTPVNTSASSTASSAATGTSTASAADINRLSDATTAAAAASAGLPAQMADIPVLPTPQQVSTVTNPYVDSLQLYETVLGATTAPADAAKPMRALDGQLRSDIATFGAAQSVKGAELGPFLRSFNAHVTVLQNDMTTLQSALHRASSQAAAHAHGH